MTATKTLGVPFADYVYAEGEHATALKEMLVSPLAYKHHVENGRPDKDALRIGRAVHAAVLEPEHFLRDFMAWTETSDSGASSPRRGAKWETFRSANPDKTILTRAQYELAVNVADAVTHYPPACKLLDDLEGEAEVSLRWTHRATGLACKGRIDYISPRAIVELKTAKDVAPRAFGSAAAGLHYPMQLAFYSDAVRSLGIIPPPCKIIAVGKEPPHDTVVYSVTEAHLAIGRSEYERALSLVAACRAANNWPGLARQEELDLMLPAWADPHYDPDGEWSMEVTNA